MKVRNERLGDSGPSPAFSRIPEARSRFCLIVASFPQDNFANEPDGRRCSPRKRIPITEKLLVVSPMPLDPKRPIEGAILDRFADGARG